jgi:hypothetical protein
MVTTVVAVMSIYCQENRICKSSSPGNEKPSCYKKVESAEFLEEKNSHEPRVLPQKKSKGWLLVK